MKKLKNKKMMPATSNSATNGSSEKQINALVPFETSTSMEDARKWMKGPALNGLPSAIWRKTAITNATEEGVFSLFVCERTNSAMWVPTGDFFVADKPKEVTRTSVLDFVMPVNPRHCF